MGKLCTIGLKAANKRLTSKEKDLQEDKKMKKKQKSDLQKAKKNRKNDDQEENEGYSDSESETENSEDKETYSQFTQASQSSQPLDEGEEIEVNPFLFRHYPHYINRFHYPQFKFNYVHY